MANNNNKKTGLNLSWLYGTIALALLGLYFFSGNNEAPRRITYSQFREYVQKGWVEAVIAYDNRKVELTILPDSVGAVLGQAVADEYQKEKRSVRMITDAGSLESLDEYLSTQSAEGNFKGELMYKKADRLFTGFLINVLPFILIIVFWVFIMRRMGGGGSGGSFFGFEFALFW